MRLVYGLQERELQCPGWNGGRHGGENIMLALAPSGPWCQVSCLDLAYPRAVVHCSMKVGVGGWPGARPGAGPAPWFSCTHEV
jgi:hypothetical protein